MKAVVCILLILGSILAVAYGQRSQCPSICPLNYDPKCGYNGKCYQQFSNACDLSSTNCRSSRAFKQVNLRLCQQASGGRASLRKC